MPARSPSVGIECEQILAQNACLPVNSIARHPARRQRCTATVALWTCVAATLLPCTSAAMRHGNPLSSISHSNLQGCSHQVCMDQAREAFIPSALLAYDRVIAKQSKLSTYGHRKSNILLAASPTQGRGRVSSTVMQVQRDGGERDDDASLVKKRKGWGVHNDRDGLVTPPTSVPNVPEAIWSELKVSNRDGTIGEQKSKMGVHAAT